jgi:hypothetical protein
MTIQTKWSPNIAAMETKSFVGNTAHPDSENVMAKLVNAFVMWVL